MFHHSIWPNGNLRGTERIRGGQTEMGTKGETEERDRVRKWKSIHSSRSFTLSTTSQKLLSINLIAAHHFSKNKKKNKKKKIETKEKRVTKNTKKKISQTLTRTHTHSQPSNSLKLHVIHNNSDVMNTLMGPYYLSISSPIRLSVMFAYGCRFFFFISFLSFLRASSTHLFNI